MRRTKEGLTLALAIAAALGFAPAARAATLGPLPPAAERAAVEEDLALILAKAGIEPGRIALGEVREQAEGGEVRIRCAGGRVRLDVQASPREWAPAFYLGLQKLGFLFPHPRIQLSPPPERFNHFCGKKYAWVPRLAVRGFHLHTEHPSEWVRGFLQGDEAISLDLIRWLARNGQNAVQVVLLRTVPLDGYARSFSAPFALAARLGILRAASVSFELTQQKSYRLVPPWQLFSKEARIRSEIRRLARAIPFDYLDIELGSTEFTSPSYERTLEWIEAARSTLAELGKSLFVKIHVSSNQNDPRYGNFNFLPRLSRPEVGVQPHTVMFYDLEDARAPVYGRRDFADMKAFLLEENAKRPVWYYPETSYFVAMDIDVPLLLTDYLVARSRDLDLLEANHVPGQITFTTGQELGYWLMDWTTALLVNAENRGDPLAGLKLLGEDPRVWQPILDFQTRWFKERGLISMLSSAIIIDELPPPLGHKLHERFTFGELRRDPAETRREAELLAGALAERPPVEGIRDPELRALMEITWLRVEHAHELRLALLAGWEAGGGAAARAEALARARAARTRALALVTEVVRRHARYPEAHLFERGANPTSYEFGYGWTAATLHFWEREESMVRDWRFSPFFMNIYDVLRVLF